MVEIKWTQKATRHLKAIYSYIANDSKIYANRYVHSLIASTDKLKLMPECGRKVPEFESHPIREIIFKNHRIIYRFNPGNLDIDILAVMHGAQDLLRLFDEESEG